MLWGILISRSQSINWNNIDIVYIRLLIFKFGLDKRRHDARNIITKSIFAEISVMRFSRTNIFEIFILHNIIMIYSCCPYVHRIVSKFILHSFLSKQYIVYLKSETTFCDHTSLYEGIRERIPSILIIFYRLS